MMVDSPLVVATAVIGMVSNCFVSVFLAIAYLKGIISFPAFLSGFDNCYRTWPGYTYIKKS